MTKIIIALSGRKSAGKNTVAQYIRRYYFQKFIAPQVSLPDNLPDEEIGQLTDGFFLECSFADNLKNFCIETLGLSRESCYGTEEEKNRPTKYLWENVSAYLRWKFGTDPNLKKMVNWPAEDLNEYFYNPHGPYSECPISLLRSGPMSARDIMQIFGTDLIRETFGNVWAEGTIRRIYNNVCDVAVVTDNRFPNEVSAVLNEPSGYIIRLTRSPFGSKDIHPSESALDNFDWNKEKCFVVDNASMSIEEQNGAIAPILDRVFSGYKPLDGARK